MTTKIEENQKRSHDSSCQTKICSNCGNVESYSWNEPCNSCLGDLDEKRLLILNKLNEWEPINWIPRNNSSSTTEKEVSE